MDGVHDVDDAPSTTLLKQIAKRNITSNNRDLPSTLLNQHHYIIPLLIYSNKKIKRKIKVYTLINIPAIGKGTSIVMGVSKYK